MVLQRNEAAWESGEGDWHSSLLSLSHPQGMKFSGLPSFQPLIHKIGGAHILLSDLSLVPNPLPSSSDLPFPASSASLPGVD